MQVDCSRALRSISAHGRKIAGLQNAPVLHQDALVIRIRTSADIQNTSGLN